MSRSLFTLMGSTLVAFALAACSDSTTGGPLAPATLANAPASPAASGGTGGGGGGGGGGARLEMSTPQGLYIDPSPAGDAASGQSKTVRGYVVVTYGHPSGGSTSFGTPSTTTVTLNGVALVPMPNTNGSYFWVDPAGPQPVVQPGKPLTLVANVPASDLIAPASRQLSLNCPQDITVAATPAAGSSLAGVAQVRVASNANLVFNPNATTVNLLGGMAPNAILFGYDSATHAFSTQSAEALVNIPFTTAGFDVTIPVGTPTSGNSYLMELTWPGAYFLDGNSGGFCGMTKHWMYTL